MSDWQDIKNAPFDQTVEVEADGMIFPAQLLEDEAMTAEGTWCDQWVATTDRFPDCWSDGCCWESNADENMSAQPERWRHIAEGITA